MSGEKTLSKEELFKKLSEAVVACDSEAVVEAAKQVIEKGIDPVEAIEKGLSKGAIEVGEKFDKMEIFLTGLMMAADAMKAGMDVLLPHISKEKVTKKGTVVSGTVKGDIHDIGKNILVALLRANGFDVYDLGVDVPTSKFIEEAERVNADIITLSALMSSTIGGQKDVIDYLKETGKREKFIVMVGGGPTTREWVEEIGADGWAETATEAVKLASELIEKKK
ncbi:dimethylamine corrinoid protein 3 [Candidatus Bathyarchaeota archaeon]|nr:MAG: dimethylamine corrinoid protein 3 [Candidatus Bathyarchaeota archaeon]